jgi:hypothetical protein
MNGAKIVFNSLAAKAIGGILNTVGRPSVVMMQSLLSGEATGTWHLTVGNPFRPIAVIGNLILANTELSFGDNLSAEGFPTEIKVNCSLKHARPRSRNELEMMFNGGKQRTYFRLSDADMKTNMSSSTAYKNSSDMWSWISNEIHPFLDKVSKETNADKRAESLRKLIDGKSS